MHSIQWNVWVQKRNLLKYFRKEYLCVQIWWNSIIICTHFSSLETRRQKLIILKVGMNCLKGRQLSLWLKVDVCISFIWNQSLAGLFKLLGLHNILNSGKIIEKHCCELSLVRDILSRNCITYSCFYSLFSC